MPQIGWSELLIIVVIAILIIGPKDFPVVIKKVGSWIRIIKKYFTDVQSNINQITDIDIDDDKPSRAKEKNNLEKNDIKK